uniref:Raptor N-terminal CASPase-like domain-containing protein n=1 Tax=Eptatretus burgeri TaxID=7764 RepID=A0A8C4QW02_EPTBU
MITTRITSVMVQNVNTLLGGEGDLSDWHLPVAFTKKRHIEKMEGCKALAQAWRMKDRMKTVSVALVLCLNVGVDPPDVVKTSPCARLEDTTCFPLTASPRNLSS